jgi:hypothetical protein
MNISRRRNTGFHVEPIGWRVEGVISPVDAHWAMTPRALVCTRNAIIAFRRGMRQFWGAGIVAGFGVSPTFSADSASDLVGQVRDTGEIVYPIDQVSGLLVRRRSLKHRIDISTRDGRVARYWVYARSAIGGYRELLRGLYPTLYGEVGFSTWWAKLDL